MKKRLKKITKITQEAQFIKDKRIDYNLTKVFTGDWKGTTQERSAIDKIRSELKDDVYIQLIYILSHKILRDAKEAKEIYHGIIDHKEKLCKKLKRNVGIEVASLDYLKNIHQKLDKPEVIEKDKLIKLATKAITDEVTGVYERNALYANLDAEIERARRYRRPLSLLFSDLDDFKKINDVYGHSADDFVLRRTAETIKTVIRATDSIYRYGGEEFICILPETDLKSAIIASKRINERIGKTTISFKKGTIINFTVSIGIAQYGINGIDDRESFIDIADQMMYRAKEAGKNRVYAYGEK